MMRFITPLSITDALLTSSTAPETDYSVWSAATTYALGDHCISTATHRIYESVQAGNLNHNPTTDTASTWWIDIGQTNRWAMFDGAVGSQTSHATPLTVVIEPGVAISALALLDLDVATVQVTMVDGAATVYDQTWDMIDGTTLVDWYGFFFLPILPRDTLVVEDLPAYPSASLTVAMTAAATAKCGTLAIGTMVDIGEPLRNPSIGIIDYSSKTTDAFGVTSVVERGYAKRTEIDVLIEAGRVDYVAKALAAVRALPVVWVGSRLYSSLVMYGYVRDWGIDIAYLTHSQARLTIEGLS